MQYVFNKCLFLYYLLLNLICVQSKEKMQIYANIRRTISQYMQIKIHSFDDSC